jgi:hypothetical protein
MALSLVCLFVFRSKYENNYENVIIFHSDLSDFLLKNIVDCIFEAHLMIQLCNPTHLPTHFKNWLLAQEGRRAMKDSYLP